MTSFEPIAASPPSLQHRPFSDPNHLAPEDAFLAHSPPRARREKRFAEPVNGVSHGADQYGTSGDGPRRRKRDKDRARSRSRRRKGEWKKLLWVRHPGYPDNYTDPPTFLSHLQRNPRLQLYDFWPLVADSTVIVQHICSVAIFVCCFVGIYQERISPVSVVGSGSAGTVLGWVLWDFWAGQEAAKASTESTPAPGGDTSLSDVGSGTSSALGYDTPMSQNKEPQGLGLGLTLNTNNMKLRRGHSPSHSLTSIPSASSAPSPTSSVNAHGSAYFGSQGVQSPYYTTDSPFSTRNQRRLATAKSAVLIYCALLGLSPILKSLTKSTTKDSIWALSSWLMLINIFFFDYGGGVGVKFPASLSTNAALMASTVLASRLTSTTHVFSLTLFSIEVFGLFPVFRRHLRHYSWQGHLLLTFALVLGAGAGMGVTLAPESTTWKAALIGILLWGIATAIGMGGCSWWLIGLQRYKNVVIGPWDPARPIIRAGQWE